MMKVNKKQTYAHVLSFGNKKMPTPKQIPEKKLFLSRAKQTKIKPKLKVFTPVHEKKLAFGVVVYAATKYLIGDGFSGKMSWQVPNTWQKPLEIVVKTFGLMTRCCYTFRSPCNYSEVLSSVTKMDTSGRFYTRLHVNVAKIKKKEQEFWVAYYNQMNDHINKFSPVLVTYDHIVLN